MSNKYVNSFLSFLSKNANQGCLYDTDCNRSVIRSHSVQNAFVLDQLELNGHVQMLEKRENGVIFQNIGRNQAGTFTGYCHHHDNAIFKEIDFSKKSKLSKFSKKQRTLFFFRAVSIEYWKKLNAEKSLRFLISAIENHDQEKIRKIFPALNVSPEFDWESFNIEDLKAAWEGEKLGCEDMKPFYLLIKSQIEKEKYTLIKTFHRVMNVRSNFAVCSLFDPFRDLAGKELDDINTLMRKYNNFTKSEKRNKLGINLFPIENKTCLIFGWYRKAPVNRWIKTQIKSLRGDQLRIPISRFILTHCENIIFSGGYEQNIEKEKSKGIKKLFDDTCGKNLFLKEPYSGDIDLFE